ncbi:N-acetyl-alpha-D-glucosaminyl L-malate synthase BshA [bacterium]|nr:N-acetyl-alpha-D-glucosaminyl L-malate synthase BshA [bacterium]
MSRLPAIGITCYPSAGGSGIVATELGLALARSGYAVHFICSRLPLRLKQYRENVRYHEVEVADYPVFESPPYSLSLATAMAETAQRHELDILHVHYAIPHAASGYLARQMVGEGRLKLITTLHGTDITLVGREPSFFPLTRFVIEQSDAVTAVSGFLADETRRVFSVDRPIDVIPNFVDTRIYHPLDDPAARARYAAPDERLLLHASNFREVKNLPAVIDVFARVAASMPVRLLLLGDGPEREGALARAAERGVADRVTAPGMVEDLVPLLPLADLMLLPSWHESFGLVALESMACGVPVIATDRGGTREFIDHGVNGYLHPPDDVEGMAASAVALLGDPHQRAHVADEARRDAVETYGTRCVLKKYVELYDRVLGQGSVRPGIGANAS